MDVPRGGVAGVRAAARASLRNPSRPFTPMEQGGRRLFSGADYSNRPTSAYNFQSFSAHAREGVITDASATPREGAEEAEGTSRADTHFRFAEPSRPSSSSDSRPTSSHCQTRPGPGVRPSPPRTGSRGSSRGGADKAPHRPAPVPENADSRTLQIHSESAVMEDEGGLSAESVAIFSRLDAGSASTGQRMRACDDAFAYVASSLEFRDKRAQLEPRLVGSLSRIIETKGSSSQLLLKAARVILQLGHGSDSTTLVSTCRMLFKLSKSSANDGYFREEHIIEPLLSLTIREADATSTGKESALDKLLPPSAAAAAIDGHVSPRKSKAPTPLDLLVYVIGTIKNVSSDKHNQQMLCQQGVFAALRAVIDYTLSPQHGGLPSGGAKSADGVDSTPKRKQQDRAAQVLVQVTATLRNLAVTSANLRQFLQFDVVDKMCTFLAVAPQHSELMLNVSRILSKLSLHEECRERLCERGAVRDMVRLLELFPDKLDLVIRVCFVLGNLTTENDACRLAAADCGAAEVLLALLQRLCDKQDTKEEGRAPKKKKGGSDVNDAQVKLIRLLANLAINQDIGVSVSQDKRCTLFAAVLEKEALRGVLAHEELLLNAVSAITNLAFYRQPLNAVLQHEKIAELVQPLLLHDNPEAKVEAARCFGNLSRYPEIREFMRTRRVTDMLVILLDHHDADVISSVCGVLINLAADEEFRPLLQELDAAMKLADVLSSFLAEAEGCSEQAALLAQSGSRQSAELDQCLERMEAALMVISEVCKVLYNCCLGAGHAVTDGRAAGVVVELTTRVAALEVGSAVGAHGTAGGEAPPSPMEDPTRAMLADCKEVARGVCDGATALLETLGEGGREDQDGGVGVGTESREATGTEYEELPCAEPPDQ